MSMLAGLSVRIQSPAAAAFDAESVARELLPATADQEQSERDSNHMHNTSLSLSFLIIDSNLCSCPSLHQAVAPFD